MPFAPLRPCTTPRCPTLVRGGGRCAVHARLRDVTRGSAAKRGYGRRWQAARAAFLSRPEHANCVDCAAEGRTVFATVVDHVIPHKGDQRLFWDETNWAPRCKYHHDRKTATTDGGFGR